MKVGIGAPLNCHVTLLNISELEVGFKSICSSMSKISPPPFMICIAHRVKFSFTFMFNHFHVIHVTPLINLVGMGILSQLLYKM